MIHVTFQIAAILAGLRELVVLLVGAILGFGGSYFQWKLTLAKAKTERKREKLELLHEQLSRWMDVIRYTIHKRNHAELYYPDIGTDPIPQIRTLMRLYAPESITDLAALIETYTRTIEAQLQPAPAIFDPILHGIAQLQNKIREKLERIK